MVVGGFGQDDSKVGSPYPAGSTSYDIKSADMFYSSRPLFVLRRLLRLANLTGAFNLKLLLDWRFGNIEKNQAERAKEALVLATQLGPTFIKLGQALSIRTDLIPEAYALELRQLQDAVPPFDSSIAKEVIRQEIGVKDLRQSFQKISDMPVILLFYGSCCNHCRIQCLSYVSLFQFKSFSPLRSLARVSAKCTAQH